jgi:hypothetical protein
LINAVTKTEISNNRLRKYVCSANEQEINLGLQDPKANKNVFCFMRQIKNIGERPLKGFIDINTETTRIQKVNRCLISPETHTSILQN